MTSQDRSVKKRKPWYRLRNVVLAVLLFIVLVVGWGVVEVLRVHFAEPVVAVNYRVKHRALVEGSLPEPPTHPDEAWALLLDITQRSDAILQRIESEFMETEFEPRDDFDSGQLDFSRMVWGSSPPSNIDRELDAIRALEEAGIFSDLDHFTALAPGLPPTDDVEWMFIEDFPTGGQLRSLVRVEGARLRLSAVEGRYADLIPSVERTLAASHTLSVKPGIIWSLVGIACHTSVLSELRHVINEFALDTTSCDALLSVIDRWSLPSAELAIEGERAVISDVIQRSFSDDGDGNGYFIRGSFDDVTVESTGLLTAIEGRFTIADRATNTSLLNEFFDELVAESKLPAKLRADQGFDNDQFHTRLHSDIRLRFVELIVPAIAKAVRHRYHFENEHQATRLMLCIEIFHARTGSYPADLNELVPGILSELPTDAHNGTTFGYHLLDDDPDGRSYLLYSFGLDGVDNGGTVKPNKPQAALIPREAEGYDYVFNPPRPDAID